MEKTMKEWKIVRYVLTALLLLGGLSLGIIYLSMCNWSFDEFIKNPTVDLIVLILMAFGVLLLCNILKGESNER